jgi:hypothetical protein
MPLLTSSSVLYSFEAGIYCRRASGSPATAAEPGRAQPRGTPSIVTMAGLSLTSVAGLLLVTRKPAFF